MRLEAGDDKLWLFAKYKTDLTKTKNMQDVLVLAESIFLKLAALGVTEIYCTANSRKAFAFNEYLGFKSIEMNVNGKYEIMKKDL